MPPPTKPAVLPLMVEPVTVSVPELKMPAAEVAGRVAAEGGVGDRQRALVDDAAAVAEAELPLRVESMTVSVPVLSIAAARDAIGRSAADGQPGDRDLGPRPAR